jgi:CRP/FNR family transcriptional regulator, cyclic AMP receptor protein
MIDGGPRSASVIAIADCSLSFLGRAKFQTCIDSRPELNSYLVKTLARRLRDLGRDDISQCQRTAGSGIAQPRRVRRRRQGRGRIQLRLKINQGDLAATAGVARENVSRTVSEWRKRNVVTRSSDYYCINNATALVRDMESETSWLVPASGERKTLAFSPDHDSTALPRPAKAHKL